MTIETIEVVVTIETIEILQTEKASKTRRCHLGDVRSCQNAIINPALPFRGRKVVSTVVV